MDEFLKRILEEGNAIKALIPEVLAFHGNKKLTYKQAMALAYANYTKGGDGFWECTSEQDFNEICAKYGGYTKNSLLKEFESYRVHREECFAMFNW